MLLAVVCATFLVNALDAQDALDLNTAGRLRVTVRVDPLPTLGLGPAWYAKATPLRVRLENVSTQPVTFKWPQTHWMVSTSNSDKVGPWDCVGAIQVELPYQGVPLFEEPRVAIGSIYEDSNSCINFDWDRIMHSLRRKDPITIPPGMAQECVLLARPTVPATRLSGTFKIGLQLQQRRTYWSNELAVGVLQPTPAPSPLLPAWLRN